MTKLEYLKQLEAGLRERMTEQEIYDIMRDYAEYFEEGKTEGKTEQDIILSLGSPSFVVSQILCEQEDPELHEGKESDDIIGAAKEKFKRIKLRMEENKRYNEQKRQEKQREDARKSQESYNGEYRSYENYNKKPRQKKNDDGGFVKTILLIILWFFVIAPFAFSILATGGGMVALAVAGIIGLSVAASFLIPLANTVGILAILTLLCGGITVLLLDVMFVRFCISKTFGWEAKQQPLFDQQTEPNFKFNEEETQTPQDFNEGDENHA